MIDNKEIINALKQKNIKSEIFQSKSDSSSIIFENNNLKKIENKSVFGKGLRVIKDGKIGFSYVGGLNDNNLIDFACENSTFQNRVNFDFSNSSVTKLDGLYNNELEILNLSDMKETGLKIIQTLNKELPDFKAGVEIEREISEVEIVNSSGFDNNYKKSFYSIFFSVVRAKDDTIFSSYDGAVSLDKKNSFKQNLDNLISLCKNLDNKGKISSGLYPVVFSPKAATLLYNILTFSFNGKNVQKGSSPLCGKIGEKLFDENFNLKDAPLIAGGISSSPFDGEATPTRDKYLIEEGRINSFIYDELTASLMNEKTTGNGRRGYSSTPSPGYYNILIEKGKHSFNDLLLEAGEGIYVDEFIGGGQSNVLAGEFSVNLTLAYKIEKGKLTHSLKDTMISGNVFNVFNNAPVFGDTHYSKSNYITPYLLARGISVKS